MITVSPLKRRIIYVAVFEVFAILFSTLLLMVLSGGEAEDSLPIATFVSVVAVIWNYIYNTGFEAWERRKQIMARTLRLRCAHAVGFEGGLFLVCLPTYMWWYKVGLWEATTMQTALLIFFLVYTFVFTLIFDKIFTLQHQNPAA